MLLAHLNIYFKPFSCHWTAAWSVRGKKKKKRKKPFGPSPLPSALPFVILSARYDHSLPSSPLKSLKLIFVTGSNGKMARGQLLGAGSCYGEAAGPVFVSQWNGLIGVRAPGMEALLHRDAATQALSSLKPGIAAGVCWWMRTKPWRNNTKWCLGWQKLICACSQKAMINDAERGNAVPPFLVPFDGDWKAK